MAETIDKPAEVFEEVLAAAASVPGVRIDRDAYLRRSLQKHCGEEAVAKAIAESPAAAGVPPETLRRIADESINYETGKVTAISTAAGIPGGLAMLGTVPADTAQYFAHVLRIAQKLAYVYGWPSLFDDDGQMDDATKSLLTLFVGIMFGAQAAGEAVSKISAKLSESLVRKLPRKALTQGLIYPIVKKVAAYLGVQMTKGTFAKAVGKIVPVVGGVVSGGITFATFRPMSAKLRDYLSGLPLAGVGAGDAVRASTVEAEVVVVENLSEPERSEAELQ